MTAFSLARISAPAPSLVCELLPAVTRALGGEHRAQLGQAFERGVGARAFVEAHGARLDVRRLAGRQVGQALDDLDRRHLVGELAGRLRLQRALVRLQRERVLRLARDLPLRGHLLGRQAHAVGDADVLVLREHLRVERGLVAAHRHHAHRLGAAGDHHVGLADADAVGRHLHRGQARGAEAVDGDAADRVRQAGQHHRDARHVHALLALGERAADDGVLDRLRVERRHLRQRAAAPRRPAGRPGRVLRK